MADLHARLLDATTPLLAGEHYSTARLNGPLAALRAVVELHAPVPCGYPSCRAPETHRVCKMCGPGINADQCSTIRVIAEKLGVEIEDKSITEKESPTDG